MQAQQLSTHRGWSWLKEGFALWRRSPALLTFLAFGYLLVLVLVSVVPFIGQPVASLIMPILSLGVLNGCRAVDNGRKVGPDILFSGFKGNVQALLTIGGLYLGASLLVLMLTTLIDGGILLKVMTGNRIEDSASADPRITGALLLAIALSTPVMMAYWFAPILAGWWKLPPTKALFFSFYACLRNWRPFLAFGIALMVFGALIPGILLGVIGLISPSLAGMLSIPLPLIMIPVVFASFYINARDVFGLPPDVLPR